MTDQPSSRREIDPEIIGMLKDYFDGSRQTQEATRAAVLARSNAVPTLIAIVNQEIDAESPEQADDLTGAAAHVLGVAGQSDAIEPLIKALARLNADNSPFDQVRDALVKMGEPALEPLLAALRDSPAPDYRAGVAMALGNLGVKDERVFEGLLDVLKADAFWGACALKDYGDPRAAPHLRQAFEDYDGKALYPELDPDDLGDEMYGDIEVIQFALEAFGVELTEEEIDAKFNPEPD